MDRSKADIAIVESRSVDDQTGRGLITFRPVFRPDVTAAGELSFAVWRMWADEPETHEPARAAALENARESLRRFVATLAPVPANPNGARVRRSKSGSTIYVELPAACRRPTDGCACDYCKAHPQLEPAWDTLAIGAEAPGRGKLEHAWTVHAPEFWGSR
jgi:hypothetical protein